MIQLTTSTTILLAAQPADFRRGIDGLSGVCKQQFVHDPRSGILFVFINRNKTMIRALSYDGTFLVNDQTSFTRQVSWLAERESIGDFTSSSAALSLTDR